MARLYCTGILPLLWTGFGLLQARSALNRCSSMPAMSAMRPTQGLRSNVEPIFEASSTRRLQRRSEVLAVALLAATLLWTHRIKPAAAKPARPVVAQDQTFQEVEVTKWAKTAKGKPDLVLGLRGEPYFLLPGQDGGAVRNFALKGECTHLGCIPPWDSRKQKFVCPCHGSEFDAEGNVLRGPAPYSLALAHVELVDGGKVQLSAWTDEDFRDGSDPWWE